MAAPKPNAKTAPRELTDEEVIERGRKMANDPKFAKMAEESRARIARGEFVTLEELRKEFSEF